MQKIYDVVLRANEAGKAAAAPGVPMEAVDKAARDVIEAAGYGEYFTHRTGHGLGLDTHEPIPQIATGVNDLLEPGMVFTVEPGIYVPGCGRRARRGQRAGHRERHRRADQLPAQAADRALGQPHLPTSSPLRREEEKNG